MKDLKELEKRYEELGKEIERLKKGKWIPEIRDGYYFYDTDAEKICHSSWENNYYDNRRLENGVIFKTKKEAGKYAEYQKAKKEYNYKFSKEEWESASINKYYIYYDHVNEVIVIDYNYAYHNLGTTWFKTKEQVKEFIDKYKDDILKYEFGVEE